MSAGKKHVVRTVGVPCALVKSAAWAPSGVLVADAKLEPCFFRVCEDGPNNRTRPARQAAARHIRRTLEFAGQCAGSVADTHPFVGRACSQGGLFQVEPVKR